MISNNAYLSYLNSRLSKHFRPAPASLDNQGCTVHVDVRTGGNMYNMYMCTCCMATLLTPAYLQAMNSVANYLSPIHMHMGERNSAVALLCRTPIMNRKMCPNSVVLSSAMYTCMCTCVHVYITCVHVHAD